MIYTLTFNPSIDYEMNLVHLTFSHTNRSTHESYHLGGKGINVSRILHELGFDSVILGFRGGFVGDEIRRMIYQFGLNEKLIELEEGISRINVKVLGKTETEINGEGPLIGGADMKQLYDQLDMLGKDDVLILSGSIPKCLNDNIYETILSVQSAKGVLCIVDATKDLLVNTLKHHPFLIKPNVAECEEILNETLLTTKEVIAAAKKLQEMGARNVMISRGKEGAVLADENGGIFESKGLKGECISSVGCGDSMVAGFIAAYLKCSSYEEAFKLAMACGSATAFSEDLAKIEMIERCYNELEVKK
ncbi:1-phosphofructokinase [uncultured Traorella sp.]|uniref:1-phosphofructokinase n=1 Tax=uncultured Traorella sp. TaxID=1929048 RepID=UPI0025CECD86|nr:1-phosphofructokinase [uncultured Traorella sp.]